MPDISNWLRELVLRMDDQTVLALLALIVSALAFLQSRRSSDAAVRSAHAAEEANKHAEKSADAAEVSSALARTSLENEAKRVRASAYWTLYRIHERLLNFQRPRSENCDFSPVQTLLAVYSHTLTPEAISKMWTALNAMEELMAAANYDRDDAEKVRFAVRDAAMILHQDWMAIGPIQDEDE